MLVYLNGKYLPIEDACISPLDRGFLFGDGIYEVIPAYRNRLFRIEQHLARLQDSLDAIRLQNPHSQQDWIDILKTLMLKQSHDEHSIYLQVTRGAEEVRNHAISDETSPTVFIMSTPLSLPAKSPDGDEGLCVITQQDTRWQRCNVKAITLLANILQRQDAVDEGCEETLLIRDNMVLEGAASNVFIVREGVIQTPPKGPSLLPGITRDLVLELARTRNIGVVEENIPLDWLFSAQEVWITSSTREISPVTRIDGKPVSDGKAGPVYRQLRQYFQDYKNSLLSA